MYFPFAAARTHWKRKASLRHRLKPESNHRLSIGSFEAGNWFRRDIPMLPHIYIRYKYISESRK